jgi:hypothetical protein
MQTTVDVVPIAGMIVVVGNSNGDGDRGKDGGGSDACLQCCSNADDAQSVADGGPDGNNGSAAIAMQ